MKKITAMLLAILMCLTFSLTLLSCEKEAKEDETTAAGEDVGEDEGGGEEAAE